MAATPRIIARLDVKGDNVVKGIHMEGLRIIGKPEDLATQYYQQGIDEIIFLDTVASLYGRNQIQSLVEQVARNVFVPLTVGGGIRTCDDIDNTLRHGADKVAINTAAIENPDFLRQASKAFGSQCIVLSVHAKRRTDGFWECYTQHGRERTHKDVLEWVAEAENLGVGEVLVTSVDKDGTRQGFDLELAQFLHNKTKVPLIVSGGAGNSDHVKKLFCSRHADAVCCGSLFHYDICSIPNLKESLASEGLEVRI